MVFNKSFFKKKVKIKDPNSDGRKTSIEKLLKVCTMEARAASLWSCVAMTIRIMIGILGEFAAYRHNQKLSGVLWTLFRLRDDNLSAVKQELIMTVSVFAGWILKWMPFKMITNQAPGFIFANPIVLLWVQDKTGIIPNIPSRACEYVLGRIRLIDLAVVFPVHFVVSLSTATFLQRILPDNAAPLALEPIMYSDGENPWIVDFCREVFITAVFTVAVRVLPVLFQLNSLPRWSLILFFFPMFNYSVDSLGTASAFCPNVLLALGLLRRGSLPATIRLICSLLGGMVGGKFMKVYLPDDECNLAGTEHR